DGAALQEVVGNVDRLIEQATGVVAKVDDIALYRLRGRSLEVLDLPYEVAVGLLVEGRDLDVDDVALEAGFDRVDADDVAHNSHIERIVPPFARNGERDRRVDGAAHFVDGLLERLSGNRRAIEMGDDVVGLQAGARRGRIVDGRHHPQNPLFHGHFDAKP